MSRAAESSFVKQAAILAAATLFARFIGFFYRVPLTFLIGDEGNALYSVGFQFYLFLLVLSSAGLPSAISKMVSERMACGRYRDAHGVFRAAMTVAVSFGFIGTMLLWTMAGHLAILFGYPGSVYAIRAVAPAVLIVAVMAAYRGYFQGLNNAIPTALSQVIEQIFNAVFKVLLAFIIIRHLEWGLEWAAAGAAAGTWIGAVLGLLTLLGIYKLVSPKIRTRVQRDKNRSFESHKDLVKELLLTAFPIILGWAIYSTAGFVDMAMISHRMAASEVFTQTEIDILYGMFTGKFIVLTTMPVAVSTALSIAILPSIAGSTAVCDLAAIARKVRQALRISFLISIPAAVGIGVLAEPILLLLFPAHPDGALLLQVGAVSIILLSVVQVATGALQGIGKIMVPVIGAAAGVMVKIPLNYVLIADPAINVIGAVISTIACYFVAAIVNLGVLKRSTGVGIDWNNGFFKPLIAAALMGLACYAGYYVFMVISFGNNAVSTIASILIGLMVYFLMLLLIDGLKEEDVKRLPLLRRVVK